MAPEYLSVIRISVSVDYIFMNSMYSMYLWAGAGGKLSGETREVNQFVTPQMALAANHESMREKYSRAAT
jgi:hypothetical protein